MLNNQSTIKPHTEALRYTMSVKAPEPYQPLPDRERLELARATGKVAAIFIAMQRRELDTDLKTGLWNERRLLRSLDHLTLEEDKKEVSSLAMVMFDLDKFKAVNDTLGHGFGDELLQFIGRKLPSFVRPTDIPLANVIDRAKNNDYHRPNQAIRRHGDEFYVIIPDIDNVREGGDKLSHVERLAKIVENIGSRVVAEVSEYEPLGKKMRDKGLEFGLSAGAAMYEPGQGVTGFLETVDARMYQHKSRHKS